LLEDVITFLVVCFDSLVKAITAKAFIEKVNKNKRKLNL
jgi:hypothetical protein